MKKFSQKHPPITKATRFFSHCICTKCFNPDLGPPQVLTYNSYSTLIDWW